MLILDFISPFNPLKAFYASVDMPGLTYKMPVNSRVDSLSSADRPCEDATLIYEPILTFTRIVPIDLMIPIRIRWNVPKQVTRRDVRTCSMIR